MRTILLITILAASGCATQTTPRPVAAAQPDPVPLTSGGVAGTTAAKTPEEVLLDAKRHGYTVVNQNGESVVCRSQLRLGSRLQKDTYCLTPAEYDELRRRTQEGLANTMRNIPPPQGK